MQISADGTALTMRRPSNMHAHLRGGALAQAIAPHAMSPWFYLVVMPNNPVIETCGQIIEYLNFLQALADKNGVSKVRFLMTVYLTERVTPRELERMMKHPALKWGVRVKWYPPHKGATTGSGHGVPLREATETLRFMQDSSIPLLGHFESTHDEWGREIPHELRESHFLRTEFLWLLHAFPSLRIVIEHASTKITADIILNDRSGRLAATITPQHLLFTDRDLRKRSWANHLKCMPVIKAPEHADGLRNLVQFGHPRVFLGDDDAAHLSRNKTGSFEKCVSGCFLPGGHSLSLYAEAFEKFGCLKRLEAFASVNGPRWYGLPEPGASDTITLTRTEAEAPLPVPVPEENDVVVPLGYTDKPDILKTHWRLA